jgi:hypothetical protein
MNSVKREVMATGMATKREFAFNTPMFGAKTFVTYIEPVFSKGGEAIGVNYVAMDITDQVPFMNLNSLMMYLCSLCFWMMKILILSLQWFYIGTIYMILFFSMF